MVFLIQGGKYDILAMGRLELACAYYDRRDHRRCSGRVLRSVGAKEVMMLKVIFVAISLTATGERSESRIDGVTPAQCIVLSSERLQKPLAIGEKLTVSCELTMESLL